ncbi:hypothetical protein D3C78_1137520 [compost metagenome]
MQVALGGNLTAAGGFESATAQSQHALAGDQAAGFAGGAGTVEDIPGTEVEPLCTADHTVAVVEVGSAAIQAALGEEAAIAVIGGAGGQQ